MYGYGASDNNTDPMYSPYALMDGLTKVQYAIQGSYELYLIYF